MPDRDLVRVTPNERAVLDILAPDGGDLDWRAYSFRPLVKQTGLDRRLVRLACRSLARKGLAAFEKGLWTEDGEVAGAGYRATDKGVSALRARQPENAGDPA